MLDPPRRHVKRNGSQHLRPGFPDGLRGPRDRRPLRRSEPRALHHHPWSEQDCFMRRLLRLLPLSELSAPGCGRMLRPARRWSLEPLRFHHGQAHGLGDGAAQADQACACLAGWPDHPRRAVTLTGRGPNPPALDFQLPPSSSARPTRWSRFHWHGISPRLCCSAFFAANRTDFAEECSTRPAPPSRRSCRPCRRSGPTGTG
jgi:hypothetical protein